MKALLYEGDEQFIFQIIPETVEDLSELSRLSLSYKRVSATIRTDFHMNGGAISEIVITKRKDAQSWIGGNP
jgi:hypothetical protein